MNRTPDLEFNALDEELDAEHRINGQNAPAFTEEALALEFATRHESELRYVASMGKWLRWDGKCWRFDETLLAFDYARKICREFSNQCNKPKLGALLASAKTVAAVERLARADRRLAASADQWDADPWLLNTPSGVIDLQTGARRKHAAEDYMTKITGVAPDAKCPISLWSKVISRAMGGDADLIAYLQRLVGYSLTGSIQEHALAFWYGTGANSKSTILSAIVGVFGNYHRTAPIETFVVQDKHRHPTDLAGLRGARLVTATETEDGRQWAEARIKHLTGGDQVPARFMRQDFFEFVPQFTPIIVGNHKPGLRTVDEAIRRRFQLVPFTVTIPPKERDPELGDKLKAEWPGILHWCIEGCLQWQDRGLAPPEAVLAATDAYLKAEDSFSAWLEEECKCDATAWERSTELFANWRRWAEQSGVPYGDTKRFRERLETRGFEHKHEVGTRRAGFQGLKLKPSDDETQTPHWSSNY
jgi:putative DNA primase/helicase